MTPIIYTAIQLIQLAFIIYLAFYKEYIKRKGSNLADKEDIAEITNQIESVKKEFTKENEVLKANLQFVINNQLQNSNEERTAIINFYDTYSTWINVGLTDLKISDYRPNNIDDLIKKERQLNDFFTQTVITQSRISLLIENSELIQISHQLIIQTLEYSHWASNLLFKLRINLETSKKDFDMIFKLMEQRPIPEEVKFVGDNERKLKEEREKIVSLFYQEKNIEYQKVLLIAKSFTDKVKEHLNKNR